MMPPKRLEDAYVATQTRGARLGPRQELSDKLKGYGEGVVHGYGEAQKQIEDITGGAITLNPPPSVVAWQERLKRSR